MTTKETGGPAFPSRGIPHDELGMTLRDWFAGQALAGLLANPNGGGRFASLAQDAYKSADAMLAARDE